MADNVLCVNFFLSWASLDFAQAGTLFLNNLCVSFGLRGSEVTYGVKGSTAGGSVSIAVMSEQLTPQLAV